MVQGVGGRGRPGALPLQRDRQLQLGEASWRRRHFGEVGGDVDWVWVELQEGGPHRRGGGVNTDAVTCSANDSHFGAVVGHLQLQKQNKKCLVTSVGQKQAATCESEFFKNLHRSSRWRLDSILRLIFYLI